MYLAISINQFSTDENVHDFTHFKFVHSGYWAEPESAYKVT